MVASVILGRSNEDGARMFSRLNSKSLGLK